MSPRYATPLGVPLGFAQPGTSRERRLLARGAVPAGDEEAGGDPENARLLAQSVKQVLSDCSDFDAATLEVVLASEQAAENRTTLVEGLCTLIDQANADGKVNPGDDG